MPPSPSSHFIPFRVASLLAIVLLIASCNRAPTAPPRDYQVVHTYPHDTNAFTEGLFYLNGFLYESTGLYGGQSSVRKTELATGKVLQQITLPNQFFGEGLATLNGKLYQLTWKEKTGFIYDLETFKPEGQPFFYPYEGWGLTTDGKSLISSDGSAQIRFIEPLTFQVQRVLPVTENGAPLGNINELEWIKDDIYANIWTTDRIVRIDALTGRVTADYDLSGLLSGPETNHVDVLNGIAYDPAGDRLFVTGKYWPKLFEIKLAPKQ